MQLSKTALINAANRAKAYAANMREKAEETVGEVMELTITAGTATALGYGRGYFGGADGRWTIGDVDVDLAIGVVAHGLAFFGAFGKYDMYLHDVGTGAFACYGTNKGFEWGKKAKSKKKTAGVRGADVQELPAPRESAREQVRTGASAFARAA